METYKSITDKEQKLFSRELKSFNDANAEFGPFELLNAYRWFFLRGIDCATESNDNNNISTKPLTPEERDEVETFESMDTAQRRKNVGINFKIGS